MHALYGTVGWVKCGYLCYGMWAVLGFLIVWIWEQQLLTQDHTKTLNELFQLAATFEKAENEAIQRVRSPSVIASISDATVSKNTQTHKGSQSKLTGLPGKYSKEQTKSQTQTKCVSCGDHSKKTYRFYNVKCDHCKKCDHWSYH